MNNNVANERKRLWVDNLMGKLTLEQKVGQLMVFGFAGPFITPSVVELITKYHVGGLRIAQKFHGGFDPKDGSHKNIYRRPDMKSYDRPGNLRNKRIACTPEEYANVLNTLRDYALDRKDSIGLHFAFDQEGEGADFLFNQRLFPHPMGLTASGNPELAYKTALCVGKQARALGANMIHSPVLDVNTNPKNPEIGPRAYSDNPDIVAKYATQSLRGFSEAGIIATGKHFPGRGESDQDAHFGLPIVTLDKPELMEKHIAPYKKMIDAGLPAVMAAFTAYPCLGGGEVPAATSREVITGFLRNELGFNGVVTTDNISMHGLLDKYEVGEAVVRSLSAGCDLILCRNETPVTKHIIHTVIEAVKSGRYPEKELDQSVQRILNMRWDMGLAENGGKVDATKAGQPFNDTFIVDTAQEAAKKSTVMLRNEEDILPLSKDKKVMLIEQIHHFHSFINNMYSHPGMLWEEMLKHSENVSVVAIEEKYTEDDKKRVMDRLENDEYDVIVTTSYYNYRSHAIMIPFLEELKRFNKPIIVVSNTPFENFGVPKDFPTALVSFCPSGRENIQAIADTIYGKLIPSAKLDVKLS